MKLIITLFLHRINALGFPRTKMSIGYTITINPHKIAFLRIVFILVTTAIGLTGFSQKSEIMNIPDSTQEILKNNPIHFIFEPISKKASKDDEWVNILADKEKYIKTMLQAKWSCNDSMVFMDKKDFDSIFATTLPKVHASINVEQTALELFVNGNSIFRFEYVENIYCRDVIEDLISKSCWAIQGGVLGNAQLLKTDTIYAKGYFVMNETKYLGGVNWSDPWARKGSSTYKGGNYSVSGYADESARAEKWLSKNYSYPVHLVTSREQSTLDYNLKMYNVLLYNEMRKHPKANKDTTLAKKVKSDFRVKTYPREPGHIYQSTWKLRSNYLIISKRSVTITFACSFKDLTPLAYTTKYEKVEMYKALEEYLPFVK